MAQSGRKNSPLHSAAKTKKGKMGTRLFMLAAVIFLGGGVCRDSATIRSPALFNFTSPVMVSWTEAESVQEQRRDGEAPTTAQMKLLSSSSTETQPDATDVREDREQLKHREKNDKYNHNTKDKKEEPGKKKKSRFSY